jgi:hypothetical protein
MMVPPTAPGAVPLPDSATSAKPLHAPRPLDPTPQQLPQTVQQPELQPAPADLMYPAGAFDGSKPGYFGSPPIRLTRDYPPVRDLLQSPHGRDGVTILDETVDGPGGPMNRFFVSGEYLLWWLPGFPTPVLATTNANTALNGYLGEPGTTAVIGPGPLLASTRSGLRLRAGAWLDDSGSLGVDSGFFILPQTSSSTTTSPNAYSLITRPVYVPNLIPGTKTPLGENGESVAIPGILRGSVTARADSELWGADLNLRKCLFSGCDSRAELFAGYRYLNLSESLTVTENISAIGPGGSRINLPDPVGTQVFVQDRFVTHNQFNGGQIGALYQHWWGRLSVDARGSLGLGDTHQVLNIDGYQVVAQPGAAPMTFRGGLLAAGPNLGRFTEDRFSVVPELTLNIGYRITQNVRVFAGYNLLLWTNVIRPGDQIDHTVDLTFVPNALPAGFSGQYRPHPLFAQRDLVVNGVQFGVDVRW